MAVRLERSGLVREIGVCKFKIKVLLGVLVIRKGE